MVRRLQRKQQSSSIGLVPATKLKMSLQTYGTAQWFNIVVISSWFVSGFFLNKSASFHI